MSPSPPKSGAFLCTHIKSCFLGSKDVLSSTYYYMKVRINKDVLVEVEKTKIDEVWDKQLRRWDEFQLTSIDIVGNYANFTTFDEDVYLQVPTDAFDLIQ